MDTTTTLMGLGLLMAFLAPVGYLLIEQKISLRKKEKAIQKIAAEHNLILTEIDFLPDLALGIDMDKRKFLSVPHSKKAHVKLIDLGLIQKCEVSKEYNKNSVSSNLDEVREIILNINLKNRPAEQLLFYTEEDHPVTEKEMRLAKAGKWQKILSDL